MWYVEVIVTVTEGAGIISNWDFLRREATRTAGTAYAPYSGLHVGAAGITVDGKMVTGCNVENASYGLTLCAECGMISQLVANGGGKLAIVSCTDDKGNVLMPCGRCRQLLHEHAAPTLMVDSPGGPVPLSELLPLAFGPDDVN